MVTTRGPLAQTEPCLVCLIAQRPQPGGTRCCARSSASRGKAAAASKDLRGVRDRRSTIDHAHRRAQLSSITFTHALASLRSLSFCSIGRLGDCRLGAARPRQGGRARAYLRTVARFHTFHRKTERCACHRPSRAPSEARRSSGRRGSHEDCFRERQRISAARESLEPCTCSPARMTQHRSIRATR